MRHAHSAVTLFIAVSLIAGMVILAGCQRETEDVSSESIVSPVPSQLPTVPFRFHTLDLPQVSQEIGITLRALPEGLVVTHNESLWLEVADTNRPSLRYTFLALPAEADGISLADVGRFESHLPSFTSGTSDAEGTMETALGGARWAKGRYLEDDEEVEDVRVFAPHPSGSGTLVVYSAAPRGVASIDERLAIIQELLSKVS